MRLARQPAVLDEGVARADIAITGGQIVAVTEEVVKLKGADGKTYEVKAADVVAENLTNGDVVEYEIVEGMPVKVKKKAK